MPFLTQTYECRRSLDEGGCFLPFSSSPSNITLWAFYGSSTLVMGKGEIVAKRQMEMSLVPRRKKVPQIRVSP